MVMRFSDPFEALWNFQKQLDARLASDWLGNSTANIGAYPPINIFRQQDDFVAIVELPGVSKADLTIEAKEGTLRISGKKTLDYQENASIHRRERLAGSFDRTITLPIRIDPIESRLNTATASWPYSSPAPKPTSPGRSKSSEKIRRRTMAAAKDLEVQKKRPVQSSEESTAPVDMFVPTTDIFETDDFLIVCRNAGGAKGQCRHRGQGSNFDDRWQDRLSKIRRHDASLYGVQHRQLSSQIFSFE